MGPYRKSRTESLLIVVAVLAWVTLASLPASAEWMADLYLGAAYSQRAAVNVETPLAGSTVDDASDVGAFHTQARSRHKKDIDPSLDVGARAGYWFEAIPCLGLAVDVSHFQPHVTSQISRRAVTTVDRSGDTTTFDIPVRFPDADLSATAIAFDLMVRWPLLTTPEFPKGQLDPYLTVGPAIFVATVETGPGTFLPQIGFDSVNDATVLQPAIGVSQSKTDTFWGVKVGAGLAWQLHKNVALFGEYRFTHFSPDFEFQDVGGGKTTLKMDLNTHHILTGVSFRF